MSASFALSHLSDNPLLLTSRSLWSGPRSTMEGIRILHEVPVWYDKTELALDFHIFEVQDFDVLIGHPVEKMFQNISPLGTLNVTLGGKDISLPILRSKDSMTEPTPQEETFDEVGATLPIETPESSLEQDAELFTEEEDDQDETIELPTHEQPPRRPIELKPLPSGLRYAFLNDNTETPIIISDKLSNEESARLIVVLESIGSCSAIHSKTLRESALPSARIIFR